MSWDQQAYSFGNPNAQPPTPTQTPTSTQFPSPTFQTPRNNTSSFEDRSGWTPTFAEEYSVFNSTPGRLTSSQHHFVETSTPRPSTAASTQNRRLSTAEDLAAELASHVHHLSPNPNLPLPPVDPSNLLPSSPGPYSTSPSHFDDTSESKVTPKKPKKRLEEAFSGQTATPPASRSRKLAPKLAKNMMQNDSQEGQYGTSQTPTHQQNLMAFPSTSGDFFSYPMSAPATAPVFTNTKPFWDPDASMGGMDLDFSTDDAGMFNMGSHRMTNSFDWGRNNQMFQETVNVPQATPTTQSQPTQPEQQITAKRQRPLAPKLPITTADVQTSMASFDFSATSAADDPFSVGAFGGVDPGLLFSRKPTVTSGFEDVPMPETRPATSHVELKPYQHQLRESQRDQEELRRSRSSRESSKVRRLERGTVSSPVKGSARPGLQRSISDSRSKRQGNALDQSFSDSRLNSAPDRVLSRTGRVSPVKLQRGLGLTSIPELPPPRTRTELKFTIDANGRARTETVVIEEEEPKTTRGGPASMSESWDSSQYESSSDDEPILVPSRNTSFSLPQQAKPQKPTSFDSIRGRDFRRHSASGYSQSESSSQRSFRRDSIGSEAETVVDEDDGAGDATRELRRVMENRKQSLKVRKPRHHRLVSDNTPRGNSQYSHYSSSNNLSPTTLTDPGTTPSSTRSGTTRCVCNNPDSEGFMIQCEACENWLHADCIGIDRRSLPPVYICAFCAQTPNMRGGRIREVNRGAIHQGSSPLAHKSFKSFR